MLLKFLRKRKNMKRIMWALAILIIPAFVIWGAGASGRKSKKGPDYAGLVFNRKVSFEEYMDMLGVVRDYATKTFGKNIPLELIDQLAWNRLLLLEEAKRENISVKDSEVVERIMQFPIFQRDNVFDRKLYKSMLGENARAFEEKIRDDLKIFKLKEKVLQHVSVSEDEIKEEYKRSFEKIKLSYIIIPFADFEKDVRYNEQDIAKFFEANKENFRRPEEINVRYIEVPFSDFEKQVFISEEEIKRYFEEHMNDYKKPGSDEMVTLDETIKNSIKDKLSLKRKMGLAEELAYKALEEALKKKDLDKTAHLFNLRVKDTGFFNMQQPIPDIGWSYEFRDIGFGLKPNEISNILVKTDRAFYILQLKEKRPPYIPALKDIKDSVIASFIKNKSIKLAEKKSKKISAMIKNKIRSGLDFETAAKLSGFNILKTDFIGRKDYLPELGKTDILVDECLALKNTNIGGPLKMINGWIIFKMDEYKGIDEALFIKEKNAFKEEVLSRKKDAYFNQWFEELRRRSGLITYTNR